MIENTNQQDQNTQDFIHTSTLLEDQNHINNDTALDQSQKKFEIDNTTSQIITNFPKILSNDFKEKNTNPEPSETSVIIKFDNKDEHQANNNHNEDGNIENKQNLPIQSLDVLNIIESFNYPENLTNAFVQYKPRSKFITMDYLMNAPAKKIKRYKNCAYFGEFVNSKRQGKGIMIHLNGKIFEGDWENDLKHGKGYEINPNGHKYEGDFLNGKPDGFGVFTWNTGEIYEGNWQHGLKHGHGTWKGIQGETYVGEWKYGKADGHGIHRWKNGDVYEGDFKNWLKHGHGKEKFGNGDYYVGYYLNGKPHGYGEYYWYSGQSYKGYFKNGLRHGKGVWKKDHGKADKYDGEWENDKKCGYGEYFWASGDRYKGGYFNDLRHGYGEMYWNDNSVYKGHWEKGVQNGEGELICPDKPIQKGIFKENIFIGSDNDDNNYASDEANDEMNNEEQKAADIEIKIKNKAKKFKTPSKRSITASDDARSNKDNLENEKALTSSRKNRNFLLPDIDTNRHFRDASTNTSQIKLRARSVPRNDASTLTDLPIERGYDSHINDRKTYDFYSGSKKSYRYYSPSQKNNPDFSIKKKFHGKLSPIVKPTRKLTYQIGLTKRELFKWERIKDKLRINPNQYKNLGNEEVCEQIRKLINPPLWRPWGKEKVTSGKSEVIGYSPRYPVVGF